MKAKSTTLKKSEKEVLNLVVKYITHWTHLQLDSIIKNEKNPILLKIGDDFVIGKNKVRGTKLGWEILNNYDEPQTIFYYKLPAILYCLSMANNKFVLADSIRSNDSRVGKLSVDKEMFVQKYKSGIKNNDDFRAALFLNRLSNTETILKIAKSDLEKSLLSAKYLNLGKTNYEINRI